MRFQFSPLTGNSYDTALLFLRRSVTTRLLAVGLPGIALLLLCLIAFVSRNTGTAITAALERNAQLRAGSVSLILEQIFTETRNQLRPARPWTTDSAFAQRQAAFIIAKWPSWRATATTAFSSLIMTARL